MGKGTVSKIRKYAHLKCAFWISISSVVILVISLFVQDKTISSILQNIFAGLITGLVITLIGSIKGKELKDIDIRKAFFDEIKCCYFSSKEAYWVYMDKKDGQDDMYKTAVCDLVKEMHSIEECIDRADKDDSFVGIMSKKPSEFFESQGEYSFSEQKKRYKDLLGMVNAGRFDTKVRSSIDSIIRDIRNAHLVIAAVVYPEVTMLEKDKNEIERSIP